MYRVVRFIQIVAISLIIPAIAYFTASWALSAHAGGPAAVPSMLSHCNGEYLAQNTCGALYRLSFMKSVAFWTGAGSVAIIAIFFVLGRVAGVSRAWNAAIFPLIMPITTALIALILLVQGVSMALPALFGDLQSFALIGLLGLLGVGAVIGGYMMMRELQAITKPQPQPVLAHRVGREQAEELWRFVDSVAQQADARTPENLIVGLEPNFFATAAPVITPDVGKPLSGETMYLSVPLMRLFSEAELRAVVAHELGHFHGEDTVYSLKFAPIYRRVALVLHALEGEDGHADHIGAAPAAMLLRYLLETFAINERGISRERELEADRAGIKAAGAEALALSLAKVAVYAPLWMKVRTENIERLRAGKISRNLSRVYVDSARFDVSEQLISNIIGAVLQTRIAHPTDSHPTIQERYNAIGYDSDKLTIEALSEQGGVAEKLFADLDAVERELTILEHNVVIGSGFANAPEKHVEDNTLLQAAYILAAAMVTADGEVKQEEIGMAESIGVRLFSHFDPTSFREIVSHIDDMPTFRELVDLLESALDRKQRAVIHAYLGEIADSDAEVAEQENALLEYMVKAWKIDEPLWKRLSPFKSAANKNANQKSALN